MFTQAEAKIHAEYPANAQGIIQACGKFEGEPLYVAALYDAVLNGCSDETLFDGDRPLDVFFVDEQLRSDFPALAELYAVGLYTQDNGFVCRLEFLTECDLIKARAVCETPDDEVF